MFLWKCSYIGNYITNLLSVKDTWNISCHDKFFENNPLSGDVTFMYIYVCKYRSIDRRTHLIIEILMILSFPESLPHYTLEHVNKIDYSFPIWIYIHSYTFRPSHSNYSMKLRSLYILYKFMSLMHLRKCVLLEKRIVTCW